MRLWLSFLLLCRMLYSEEAAVRTHIEKCPPNAACAIFVNGSNRCTHNGVYDVKRKVDQIEGYTWEARTQCYNNTYLDLKAALEIEPLTLRKWRVKVTRAVETFENATLDGLAFEFGCSTFEFQKELKMEFRFKKDGFKPFSIHPMKRLDDFSYISETNDTYNFTQFSFEIDAGQEKLINLIDGQDVRFLREFEGNKIMSDIEDGRFAVFLGLLNPCDFTEIKQVCYGSCDKITSVNATVVCPSKLWFSEGGLKGAWMEIFQMGCIMGSWHYEWIRGIRTVDETLEIQCSAEKPEAKPPSVNETDTSVNKTDTSEQSASQSGKIFGFAVGGVLLIGGLVVAIIFLLRALKRRKEKRTVHSVRVYDLSSPKQKESARTPGENMPEYTAQTDFEGLKTEILEEKTATAKLTEQSIETGRTKGSVKHSRHPSTKTTSIKVDTATFTPTFTTKEY